MTSERECYVYIVLPGKTEFVTAGRFRLSKTRDGDFLGAFVYGRHYLERSDAVELDPVELRVATRVYETARMEGFFGAIRDSMPDYWGRRVIEKHSGLTVLDEFDYLMEGPDDRAGALSFGIGVQPPAPHRKFNQAIDLERLQASADSIFEDHPGPGAVSMIQAEELLDPGTSMGGARPKATVKDGHSLWIAKFSQKEDRWNYSRVEHALLKLAAQCGINTVDSRIETINGRDIILVRRFDREWAETGYRRHRMVSALTLLKASDNPDERKSWSYLLLADEIRRTSANPEKDLHELFSRLCFNAATSNLDDHPRNHAILAKDRSWCLSPAFDLTPSPVVALDRRDLAMTCGKFGRYANKANLLSEHGRFMLSTEEATAIFDNITETVRKEWLPAMRRTGASEADCEAIKSAFLYEGLFYEGEE